MSFTAKINQLRKILGHDEHFQREKKIPLFHLVVSLISTFTVTTKKKTIADAHRHYIHISEENISRSSFWDRLANPKLLDFLEKTVLNFSFQIQQKALSQLRWLSTFTDVFIYDASPIRLPKSLSDKFPGNRKNHSPACIKFSALYQMSVRGIKWLKLTPQKIHDSQILPDLEQLKGSLFLFDLGYFSHLFLHQLNEARVWFVCRLKANSIPIITRVVKGVAKRHIGRPLNKKVNLRGDIVEVWAKLMLPGKGFIQVRLIGFRFPKTKQYRWYASNLPDTMLLAERIYPIYRLRWQIELFFKSLKSTLNADQITSGNENIALSIVYSSILSSLISSSIIIEEAIVFAHIELKSITAQRILHVFSLFAHNLAQCLISKEFSNVSLRNNLRCLMQLLVCPNRKHRPTSLEIVAMFTS